MALRPRINIYDTDYTTISGSAEDVLDIAFVPGFSNRFVGSTGKPSNIGEENAIAEYGSQYKWDTNENIKYVQKTKPNALPIESQWGLKSISVDAYSVMYQDDEEAEPSLHEFPARTISLENIDVTPIVENRSIDQETGSSVYATELYDSGDDPQQIGWQVNLAKISTGEGSTAPDITVIAEITLSKSDDAAKTATVGILSYDENANPATAISVYECTVEINSQNAYYYEALPEADYDYTVGQIIRYDTLSDFKAAVGNEPYSVWGYKIDGSTTLTLSNKSLYDFAAEQAQSSSAVDIAAWINAHLIGDDAIEVAWVDTNWIYAAELLMQGLPVYYYIIKANDGAPVSDVTVQTKDSLTEAASTAFKADFESVYAELADKGEYNIKYITTGTFGIDLDDTGSVEPNGGAAIDAGSQFIYPFYDIGATVKRSYIGYLADIVNYRKDAVVLADGLRAYDSLSLNPANESVYKKFDMIVNSRDLVNTFSGDIFTADEQAKMGRRLSNTFPWYKATVHTVPNFWRSYRTDKSSYTMPGSFAYLISLATSIQKYESASWEAIAGVTRALVPDFISLDINERLSNAVADAYNKRNQVGINAITNIRPYGYCIWGNRTLVDNAYFAKQGDGTDGLIASSFVDIMSMVCNVNKIAYRTCKRLMFEKDNDVLWTRFRQGCEPYLDQLLTAGALRTYTVEKLEPTMRGQLVAKITLYPTYSVENFDIEIALRDVEAEVNA